MKSLEDLACEVKKSPKLIFDIPYTEFLALINQTNVPPGAFTTINEWVVFGNISSESKILELACSTGFSLRELTMRTGASGIGADICQISIERAKKNAASVNMSTRADYRLFDAHKAQTLLDKEGPTHVAIGASLRFIDNQQKTPFFDMLFEGINHKVTVLTCEFFSERKIRDDLVRLSEQTFGITPTGENYKHVTKPYFRLKKVYEIEHPMRKETEEELKHYCTSTISRFRDEFDLGNSEAVKLAYDRLYKIKSVTNDLREYQNYACFVHEYDPQDYGRRYTELF